MTKKLQGVVVEKKDEACHIPLESEISIVTIFHANMLIFAPARIWLPWKHQTDAQTMIQ